MRVTPAKESNLTDHVWTIAELLAYADCMVIGRGKFLGRLIRILLVTVLAGSIILLVTWWNKKHPFPARVIRNGEIVVTQL